METFQLVATCPEETKDILVQELEKLGATDIRAHFKAVSFTVDEKNFYRAHLWLRTASRLITQVKEFPASSLIEIERRAAKIHWEEIFTAPKTYLIEGIPGDRGTGIPSSNALSKAVRLGLEDYCRRKKLTVPVVNLKDPEVVITIFLRSQHCLIGVDTTGKSMHKRGYRGEGHPAPMKETLAASLLDLVGYDGSQPLLDPMCGSGTLVIEACMKSLGKAPLIHRKKDDFGFEHLQFFNRGLWRTVQEEARATKMAEPAAPIFARDINAPYVELTKQNALRARVEKYLQTEVADFFAVPPPCPSGLLISNLPYGERLNSSKGAEEAKEFYQKIGDQLKRQYKGWRAALLTSANAPYKFIGLKPTRKISLLNGHIETKLLIFDIYEGSKRKGPAAD